MAARFFNSGRFGGRGMSVTLALALSLTASMAAAQQGPAPAAAPSPAAQQQPGFFGSIGAWFDRQAAAAQAAWQGMGRQVETLGHEADAAAKTTVDSAKRATGTMEKLRNTTVVAGNETCVVAPNGAPDCVAAARALCKAKGYESGQSLAMTTAENCPAKVYLEGRNTGVECTPYTFVSRALCQ